MSLDSLQSRKIWIASSFRNGHSKPVMMGERFFANAQNDKNKMVGYTIADHFIADHFIFLSVVILQTANLKNCLNRAVFCYFGLSTGFCRKTLDKVG